MSVYDRRPWLARYAPGQAADLTPDHPDLLGAFAAAVRRAPDAPALRYLDHTITLSELDARADAFAAALRQRGFARGDRLALYLQNVPEFVVALLATWKAGGIAVPVNPMSRRRELAHLLGDSGATVLVCAEELRATAHEVVTGQLVVPPGALAELLAAHEGQRPPPVRLASEDVALFTYTSGTTGPPKGALNTHGNLMFSAQVYRDWLGLTPRDSILGIAPLFHITGLVAHVALALLVPAPLVLAGRFEPGAVLDALRAHRPTMTIGAVTAFLALLHAPGVRPEDLASLRIVYSGGAPVSPATAAAFERFTGTRLHSAYGLTETTSPSHLGPLGADTPVDPVSGALAVGVPVPSTVVRVVDDGGRELPTGEVGEIVTEGPQVVGGYWRQPDESARAIPGGRLHTGDVGFMDERGWFYVVDRKKDQINASGYKVWPREVEDVLYEHPAVREAAVVGVPDAYRGETVKAFVSLKPGAEVTPAELIAFARERLAAYKYPRIVELVEELPKTATGKILRRELRGV